jgi:cell division protein FtsB
MLNKIKNNHFIKSILNSRSIGLYLVVIIALSVTWSSIKIIQKNYGLEKQIVQIQQEVDVLDQQTKNQKLKNEYYKTDAYLDLAVRKYFGKALPGEKLIIVPSEISQKYVHQERVKSKNLANQEQKPQFIQNLQKWINFFTHKQQGSQQ